MSKDKELTTLGGAVPYIISFTDVDPIPSEVFADVEVRPLENPTDFAIRVEFRRPDGQRNNWVACTWIEAKVTDGKVASSCGRIGSGAGLVTRTDCKDTVFVPTAIDVCNIRLKLADRTPKPFMIHPVRPLHLAGDPREPSPAFLAELDKVYEVKPVIWNLEKLPKASLVTVDGKTFVRFNCGSPKLVFDVPLVEGSNTYKVKTALVIAP